MKYYQHENINVITSPPTPPPPPPTTPPCYDFKLPAPEIISARGSVVRGYVVPDTSPSPCITGSDPANSSFFSIRYT